jgi:hypothetical protein
MTIDYFAMAADAARRATRKSEPTLVERWTEKREHDPTLCIVCQNEPRRLITDDIEDETCGSMACREAWYGEVAERH